MQPHDFYKLCGLLSALLIGASTFHVLRANSIVMGKSISHHAAMNTKAYYLFAIGMTAAMTTMFLYVTQWLIPSFQLGWWFTCTVIAAITLEVIATFVPLKDGWRFMVHQSCSYTAAALMPILLLTLLQSPRLSAEARLAPALGFATILSLISIYIFQETT